MNKITYLIIGIAAALLVVATSFIINNSWQAKYAALQLENTQLKNAPPQIVESKPDTILLPGEKIIVTKTITATVKEPLQIAYADSALNIVTEDYISNLYAQYDLKKKLFYFDQNIEVFPKEITRVKTITKTVTINKEIEKPKTFFDRFNISLYAGFGYSIKGKQPDASIGLAFTFALF
ncbi:MAG: hypothetical protein WC879_17340 [Melioribacteraceae bacterium]